MPLKLACAEQQNFTFIHKSTYQLNRNFMFSEHTVCKHYGLISGVQCVHCAGGLFVKQRPKGQ